MAKKYLLGLLPALIMMLGSCSDDLSEPNDVRSNLYRSFLYSVRDFEWDDETRTIASVDNAGLHFRWAFGDTLGIYPNVGSQVEFVVDAHDSTEIATAYFDGGAWAFKPGYSYCAFYPYNFYNRTRDNIRLDFTGQVQTGCDDQAALRTLVERDYIYSVATQPEDGEAHFSFEHIGSCLWLTLHMPNPGTYTSLSLRTRQRIFPLKQRLDLSADEPVFTPVEMSSSCTLQLDSVSIASADSALTVALRLPSIDDLSGHDIYITVTDSAGHHYSSDAPVALAYLRPNKAYRREVTMICEGEPGYIDAEPYEIRFLALGNSYTADAFCYVPLIIEDLLPNADVRIGITYWGNANLNTYNTIIRANMGTMFYHYTSAQQRWTATDGQRIATTYQAEDWDFWSMQQASTQSGDYSTISPYLSYNIQLLTRLRSDIAPPSIWIQTHAYADGYKAGVSSDSMYYSIADASRKVVTRSEIQHLIPYGTAIQNARHTALDCLGTFVSADSTEHGHLSSDGTHIDAGLPRLTASYATAQAILDLYGLSVSIADCQLTVSDELNAAINIPDDRGCKVQPVSSDLYDLAKQCALKAIEHPDTIWMKRPEHIDILPDSVIDIQLKPSMPH